MNKYFAAFAMFASVIAVAETFATGYRILHSSPQEVVSALMSPSAPQNLKAESKGAKIQSISRMQKYFRVRKKTVEGSAVRLEVAPELPLVGEEFADANIITLQFNEVSRRENTFVYDLKIITSADRYIDAQMTIEPNIAGSLLTVRLKNPSLLSKAFSQAALSLGFLERSPQAAEARDRQRQ